MKTCFQSFHSCPSCSSQCWMGPIYHAVQWSVGQLKSHCLLCPSRKQYQSQKMDPGCMYWIWVNNFDDEFRQPDGTWEWSILDRLRREYDAPSKPSGERVQRNLGHRWTSEQLFQRVVAILQLFRIPLLMQLCTLRWRLTEKLCTAWDVWGSTGTSVPQADMTVTWEIVVWPLPFSNTLGSFNELNARRQCLFVTLKLCSVNTRRPSSLNEPEHSFLSAIKLNPLVHRIHHSQASVTFVCHPPSFWWVPTTHTSPPPSNEHDCSFVAPTTFKRVRQPTPSVI